MIEGLDRVLEGRDQPGLTELKGLLQQLLGGCETEGRLIEEQTLQPVASRTAPAEATTSFAPSSTASRRRRSSVSTAISELEPSSRTSCRAMWPTPPTPSTTAVVPGTARCASCRTAW